MQMIARIRAVVDVPFDFDVGDIDENGDALGRRAAAEHAVETLLADVLAKLDPDGVVVADLCMVEEVRDA